MSCSAPTPTIAGQSLVSATSLQTIRSKSTCLESYKAGAQSEVLLATSTRSCTKTFTCNRCQATPDNFDAAGIPRFRAHTCQLWDTYEDDPGTLWDVFGIVDDVTVRMMTVILLLFRLLILFLAFHILSSSCRYS